MNLVGTYAIFAFEMQRFFRTLMQSLIAPVISTALYFVVFGSAIGKQMTEIEGISYGSFIVPGMIMLALLGQSISNASFGIYFPKFSGTIFEYLSAPVSAFEMVIGFVGAAAVKSILIGVVILMTSYLFVPVKIMHPIWMIGFLLLTAITFSLFGFIIGLLADGFDRLQIIPLLVVTPLTFLGGSFYSIKVLPEFWQTVSYFNPVVYLISGFRWAFYEVSDVSLNIALSMTTGFLLLSLLGVWWIFHTGYKIKN
ncbi:MAG: ABC transporter permease [Alphaproteobacteria bacterium]|nr:ABC transporter permease [Alphaproteobacteria bacterium]